MRCGGGTNHRAGLYDAVLVKENHLRIAGGIPAAAAALRGATDGLQVEVEAETLAQVREAIDAGIGRILLDNMSPQEVAEAVALAARPRRARGVRRRLARDRPRLRRDRCRLRLRGRAHARRALAPRVPGGAMTTLEIETMQEEIRALARERDAVIIAHNYQRPEVQDVADYVGDSLGLSRQAAATDADVIVFCGVHFMAETAAILSPEKTVLLPDLGAGCSLAASITADQLREWKAQHPGAVVVSYVNTTAEVKAESDYCCTSGQRAAGDRGDPGRPGDPLPAGHVPRALARARHRPHADDLDGRVPRARGHPPRRHRAVAGGGAGRRAARASGVRLREPGDGVRERADADPLDGEDGRLREALAEAAVPHRDRDRHHPPARARGARARRSSRCARTPSAAS